MIQVQNNIRTLFFFCVFLALWLPTLAAAADASFISLVGVPGLNNEKNVDMQVYVNTILRIAIIAAALVAVIKLILAGAQYVLSGVVTNKQRAKADIVNALLGLLIIIGAVTILTTINPKLTNLPSIKPAEEIARNLNIPKALPECSPGQTLSRKTNSDGEVEVTCKDRTDAVLGEIKSSGVDTNSQVYILERDRNKFELLKQYGAVDGNYFTNNDNPPSSEAITIWQDDCAASGAGHTFKEVAVPGVGTGYYCGKSIQ